MSETIKDIRKWRGILYSWTRRCSVIKKGKGNMNRQSMNDFNSGKNTVNDVTL
jgi:hypothetical protein